MVNQTKFASVWFWNFVGFGVMCFAIGSGWSVSRAKAYQLELAQYKLQVGTVLSDVSAVSNTLEQTAKTAAIAPAKKRQIQQLTNKTEATIEQIEAEIEQETSELILLDQREEDN